jgi:hypothetical protein
VALILLASPPTASILLAGELTMDQPSPTALFPKPAPGEPLRQYASLQLHNAGESLPTVARITIGKALPVYTQDLGDVPKGDSAKLLLMPDVARPTPVTVELLRRGSQQVLAARQLTWQPQKKWKIYCVSFSHHDLGYGNYPHRLRTDIRHANIERLLRFCSETDGWDEPSKFRFAIETSEPLTSFLGSHSEADAAALASRIREGRIQVGALQCTPNSEQLGHEMMARLFYLAGRHTPDLLSVSRNRTAMNDDVIGLTWPLSTYCAEAGVSYFFHGHNGCASCLRPADSEPVFFWQGPGGDRAGKVLIRSTGYGGEAIGDGGQLAVLKLIAGATAAKWPYDSLLSEDGTDFTVVSRSNADKIHRWNSQYAFPRLICATMDMFFDAIVAQADPSKIKTFARDGNNEWADQDASDAWALGHARQLGELIPTAEKFSTIAMATAGGGYPWTDVYQAYHRVLLYHEHTDAIDTLLDYSDIWKTLTGHEPVKEPEPKREKARQYETELMEDREMVIEAREFCERSLQSALRRLAGMIATKAERNIVVFNPLPHARTDVVYLPRGEVSPECRLVDDTTWRASVCQAMPDGRVAFVASDVPATGYKTFSVLAAEKPSFAGDESTTADSLESRFYRVVFDPASGAIAGIRDKELDVQLVDQTAADKFNQYLYERYETPAETGSSWYRPKSARLQSFRGPVADVMVVEAAAVGVEKLQQTVVLYHNLKRIDFVLDMVKSPSGRTGTLKRDMRNKEAVYVALPLAVPDFEIRHELPGGVAEPIRQQFDGSCTAHYTVRHFTDVSGKRYGVSVSSPDVALVEYGFPRSSPTVWQNSAGDKAFESRLVYPANSRVYLYLLNNMFCSNVRFDQRGPLRFTYSICSHAGDWRKSQADQFGWAAQNPLLAVTTEGPQRRSLPAAASFVSVDQPNVTCTTIKPSEANGPGFILRFCETRGRETPVVVSLPFVGNITSANETSLVEDDRPLPLEIRNKTDVRFTMPAFGVRTIRVVSRPAAVARAADIKATPTSDMEISLSWWLQGNPWKVSHFNVYRGTKPDFRPTLLNLVQRPTAGHCDDRPALNYGGWINNRLEPDTTYYYRIAAVDRWNNEGPLSAAVKCKTLRSSEKDMVPLRVECLRAILVSPITPHDFVNLLWRTACESDVRTYEVHRSTRPGFRPDTSTKIGTVDADAIVKGTGPSEAMPLERMTSEQYGHVAEDHHMYEYDHLMYADCTAQPNTTYYYRVRAVDRAGQAGPFSAEATVRTGQNKSNNSR